MNHNNLTLRQTAYHILNNTGRLPSSVWVSGFIIALIIFSVSMAALETVDSLYAQHRLFFLQVELFSLCVFSIEYVVRVWSSIERPNIQSRLKYVFSFESVVDLLAILPFLIGLLFELDLRALIMLRLLRLLKLIRYFEPLSILGNVVRAELRAFMSLMFVLIILVFVAATGIYYFERNVQPDVFGSIPLAMYWATVTLTTLGYGDVVPVTVAGRIFASCITILSIGTVALPAGMLASRFSEELRTRKKEMNQEVAELLADGHLSDDDNLRLEQLRSKLCLSEEDIERIIAEQRFGACPMCGRGPDSQA